MKLLVKRMCRPMWNLVPDLGIGGSCLVPLPVNAVRDQQATLISCPEVGDVDSVGS